MFYKVNPLVLKKTFNPKVNLFKHHRAHVKQTKRSLNQKIVSVNDVCKFKKNAMLSCIFFSSLYQYTIVRNYKEIMIISACGVEAIPFMKTWVNFPISMIFLYMYQN